jgi:anthranilate synthase component 1
MNKMHKVPLDTALSPHELFARIRQRHRNAFLLESREGPRRLARYSIVGFSPPEFFRDRDGENPLPVVRRALKENGPVKGRGFVGGLVGVIAYDAAFSMEPNRGSSRPPHFLLGLYRDGVVYNHHRSTVTYFTLDEDRSGEVVQAAEGPAPAIDPVQMGRFSSSVDANEFSSMVLEAKRQILHGEAYQIVLSRRFDASYRGNLDSLYGQIRLHNPSPYLYHLDFEDVEVLGSSPEMLVRVENRQVETFPIAGTRPIGVRAAEDARRKAELLADPKEVAEHLMLVDMARNDVGRVSQAGTVSVPRFCQIESYSSVHHLVSHVTGRLREKLDAVDAFRSLFPAGTVTGAPKIRAMEIISKLEKAPRGLYAGAVGYFGFNGNLDSAIAIRTVIADKAGRASVQAGAGIVQDSVPQREFEETRHKADSILKFVEGSHDPVA